MFIFPHIQILKGILKGFPDKTIMSSLLDVVKTGMLVNVWV